MRPIPTTHLAIALLATISISLSINLSNTSLLVSGRTPLLPLIGSTAATLVATLALFTLLILATILRDLVIIPRLTTLIKSMSNCATIPAGRLPLLAITSSTEDMSTLLDGMLEQIAVVRQALLDLSPDPT